MAGMFDFLIKEENKNKIVLFWNTYNSNDLDNYIKETQFDYKKLPKKFHKFFEETKNSCDYFIKERDLIKDMKRYLHKEEPLEKMNIHVIRKNYEENRDTKENLKNIIKIIYRVRNNLTHGSKEMNGNDVSIIKKAIPILKSTIRIIAKRVFDVSLS